MEPKIVNGRFTANGLGMPEVLEGMEALLQRVYNRLNIKRGSFCYDPKLGSRIPEMKVWDRMRVLQFAAEALLPCPEIRVTDAEMFGDRVEITVETPMGSGTVTVYRKENEDDV